jgi:hypothetical protein
MKKIINIYETIVDRCMSDPRYVTQANWSEIGVPGFGSLITEDCGEKIRASLVIKGIVVIRKYFNKDKIISSVA